MGFSNIFAAALAFSVLIGIFYILYESLPEEVVDMGAELTEKYDDLALKAATQFSIENVTYFSDTNLTIVVLENGGGAMLDPAMLSFIIDGNYLDESTTNISRTVLGDGLNPDLWDTGEGLSCNLTYSLGPGIHNVKAFYGNGVWCSGNIKVIDSNINLSVSYADPVEGTLDASADITGFGAGNDTEFWYIRVNVSGPISESCTYSCYIDVDSSGSTGIATAGSRTLIHYPTNVTQAFDPGAGVEYMVNYRGGTAKLFSQGDLGSMLEERAVLDFSNPTGSSLLIRVPLADLGNPSNFSFYLYGVDQLMRHDLAPDA